MCGWNSRIHRENVGTVGRWEWCDQGMKDRIFTRQKRRHKLPNPSDTPSQGDIHGNSGSGVSKRRETEPRRPHFSRLETHFPTMDTPLPDTSRPWTLHFPTMDTSVPRSTSCGQWRVQTRRILVWRSTSVGRWKGKQGYCHQSRQSTCVQGER